MTKKAAATKAKSKPKAAAKPATVQGVLAAQPPERRGELERVRAVVNARIPAGYVESAAAGMITWEVPLSVYPDTYNGHPLWYVALGAHKSTLSLYMMMAYANATLAKRLEDGFAQAGKTLKMGKSCINFAAAADLALDTIGDVVAAVPMAGYVATAKAARKK
ncbi:MAG TPA: DUF1801 domain-containing protein [Gemmatimonadales bacterium]